MLGLIEAIVMVLATSSLGASWSCTSPELGDTAILERFTQGVRFGSAEVYAVLEPLRDQIEDSIVVGLKTQDGDERVILFVKPKHGDLTPSIVKNIQDTIRTQLSKRHVPAKIIACPEIPYTSTGKRLEVALKKVINGTHPSKVSTTAMVNADCMKWFYQLPELEELRQTPPAPKVPVKSKL